MRSEIKSEKKWQNLSIKSSINREGKKQGIYIFSSKKDPLLEGLKIRLIGKFIFPAQGR